MTNLIPVPMTAAELAVVLDDIRERVLSGDSFEGNIEYLMPDPDDENSAGADVMVKGMYRIGNSAGQGGVRLIGVLP